MLAKGNARRTSQRIGAHSGSFTTSHPTKKSASIQFNRFQQQFKKKFKRGSTSEMIDSVKDELGWTGLCALFLCVMVVVVVIIILIYPSGGGGNERGGSLHDLHNQAHPDHVKNAHDINSHLKNDGMAMDHGLNVDPEHWPHHMSGESGEEGRPGKRPPPPQPNDNNNNKNDARYELDKQKMKEYLDKTQRRPRPQRDEKPPQEFDEENRAKMMEGMKDRRFRDRKERSRMRERERNVDIENEIGNANRERQIEDKQSQVPDEDQKQQQQQQQQQKRERQIEDKQTAPKEDEGKEKIIDERQIGQVVNEQAEANNNAEAAAEAGASSPTSNWDQIWSYISTVDIGADNVAERQAEEADNSEALAEKAYLIKAAFLHAWHGYAKHALGHDEIQPVSDLPGDSWGGLGATLIDALDTMMLMGVKEEFKEARDTLQKVHFDIDLQVSFFETTIRHLGGLIGAYEMSRLLGPEDGFILAQAKSLADHLLPAFNTRSGIPKSMVNLQSGEIKNYGWTKDRSVLAEVGSNQLEFYAMSEYTNDGVYYEKSASVFGMLHAAQMELFDADDIDRGLYSRLIETDEAKFTRNEKVYSLGGMSDSFYEYTLKLWILTGYRDKLAIKMYVESMQSANEKLLRMIYDKKRRDEPYFFYGEQWYSKFRGKMEELQCFMPGVLALGSYHAMLRAQEAKQDASKPLSEYEQILVAEQMQHLKLAHMLIESCVALYTEMPTGLAPESIEFTDTQWSPKEMKYQLRPETLESLFILYSLTGNAVYRQWGWKIFESIQAHCKTDVAFSGIQDVAEIPAKQDNQMQSYVMAETFKYLFMLFDDDAAKLLPLNEFVFNTEAHPIRIMQNIEQFEWYQPQRYSNDQLHEQEEAQEQQQQENADNDY